MTEYVRQWFDRANDDMEAARVLLESNGIPNAICFHAEQAAEKYIKGFFAHHEKHIRKIHDLTALVVAGVAIDASLKAIELDATFLDQFYLRSRYPDDYVAFTREDAEKAFQAALRVKEFVLGKIS